MMRSKTKLIAVLLLVLAACVGGIIYLLKNAPPEPAGFTTALDIGGPFTLMRHDGERVSSTVYKDKFKLVYFGFTHCPAICPTELQKITTALDELGIDAQRFQPIFISVDPERDTQAVLKDYVALFTHNMVGFTGSEAEIEAVKRQFRVYAAKAGEADKDGDYNVDHSSYIYVLDENDKVIELFNTQDTSAVVAARLRVLLGKTPRAMGDTIVNEP